MTEPKLTEAQRDLAQVLLHAMLNSGCQPNSGDLAIAQVVAIAPTVARMVAEAEDAVRAEAVEVVYSATQQNDVNGNTRDGRDWLRGARHVAQAIAEWATP